MSRQRLQLERFRRGILWADQRESAADSWVKKSFYWVAKWFLMIGHESVKDNSKVRAESLAYLMIFSLVPMLAGAFFIFSFFTQFAFVQESLQNGLHRVLSNFPTEHQQVILEYGTMLKDRYLASISRGSAKLGIFALGVFLYVGVQTFNNVEGTINHIWGADTNRPFFEKLRNFLVVAVVAPLAITASLSLPLIIRASWGKSIDGVMVLSSIEAFIGWIIPVALTFATFLVIYKFIPVRHVNWRAAAAGALCGSVGLQLANSLVSLYVRFATHTTYGKAAVFLVLGFWIYIVWMIVIIGAQISYLTSDGKYLLKGREAPPSMYEGYSLILVLARLLKIHKEGGDALTYQQLFDVTHLSAWELRRVMAYLEAKHFVARIAGGESVIEGSYLLAKDISETQPSEILKDFMRANVEVLPESHQSDRYHRTFNEWAESFDQVGFRDFL
ncbi:MAG TPA: YihY/virulence factor BrkB family protein [Bdellovibrionota bacterium]|nr:YihY/virulence factor BrkB family protein [Bdellovibrionota bacterium]